MRHPTAPAARALAALAAVLLGCGSGGRRAGVGEVCAAQAECVSPLLCTGGKCVVPVALAGCIAGARRCDGADVLECDPAGLRETVVQSCAAACHAGKCADAICSQGDRRCGATGVEVCGPGPSGSLSWQLAEPCPSGCDLATRACRALACRPLDVRCSQAAPGVVQLCAADGSSWVDQACGAGLRCADGACVPQRCRPGASSCDGSAAVTCNADGSGYATQTQCPAGCASGACLATACATGQTRCEGSLLERCKPDGTGFAPLQECAEQGGCIDSGLGRAACSQGSCTPLARRCSAQGAAVEVCAGDGSAWIAAEACDGKCFNGACAAPPSGCSAGQLRCAGAAVQRCDGGGWHTVGQCLGSCSSGGVCSGGSCAAGLAIRVPLPACAAAGTCVTPADGASSLLATVGPILDLGGAAVPDGTLVTVAATGGAGVLAADAAPAVPGVQVRTHGGFADFAFRAPPASAIDGSTGAALATLAATVAGADACAAAVRVPFGANPLLAYVAEDFTTTAARDVSATTADWRTDLGDVEALRSEFGDGRDGDLDLGQPGSPPQWSLDVTPRPCANGATSCAPLAVSLRVVGLEPLAARVEGATAGFASGDEALLIEVQGASPASTASAGSWELLTVGSVSDGRISFTTPIAGTYGATPGALNGERVLLQRVPHLRNLTVPSGSTLTASAWNGQRGGVLAFRASGRVSVAGAITADGLGFRGGAAPDALHGQAGESFGGSAPVLANVASRNLGGGSGGYLCGDPYHLNQLNTWYGSGGSFGGSGSSTCAAQGAPYGTPTLARLFLGSGSGSQEQNTQTTHCAPGGYAAPGVCPADSSGGLSSKLLPGVNCGAGASLDLNCVAAACRNDPACIQGFTVCQKESHSANSTLQRCYDGNCNDPVGTSCGADQNCINALTYCAGVTAKHPATQLPCDAANPGCQDTFSVCRGYNVNHADSPYPGNDCSTACPRLVHGAADCGRCGCYKWGVHDCDIAHCDPDPYCVYVCTGRDCGGDGTTGFLHGCSNKNNTCAEEGNCNRGDYCTSNCNIFGSNCDCHKECFQCWNGGEAAPGNDCTTNAPGGPFCNTCNICTGCVTNPGCQFNQGCTADLGCQTCGGLTGSDGARCDITDSSNTCACPLPWQRAIPGAPGGGIVFVAAASLDLAATGTISSRGLDAKDGATPAAAGGAGGSLWLRLGNLTLATGAQLSANGGVGGGAGRVRLERAGGDDPLARGQIAPTPYLAAFALPGAQSVPFVPSSLVLGGKRATSAALVSALDAPPQAWSVYAGSSGVWSPAVAGGAAVSFGATRDVRWRVQLAPQGGQAARTYGVVWQLTLQ